MSPIGAPALEPPDTQIKFLSFYHHTNECSAMDMIMTIKTITTTDNRIITSLLIYFVMKSYMKYIIY